MGVIEISPIIESAGFVTVFGLVIWVVKRVFSHTIPRLASDFKESLGSQQSIFAAQLELQRQDFKEVLSGQRQDFRDSLREEREQADKRANRLTDTIGRLANSTVEVPDGN